MTGPQARRNALARERGFPNYYAERLSRARRAHPGISTRAARGHPTENERSVSRLIREIGKLPPGSQVSFTGTDRQADGTWRRARFDVMPGDGSDETTTIVGPENLTRLSEIQDALARAGILVLGAKYLARMAADTERELYAIRRRSSDRYLSGVGKKGRARTVLDPFTGGLVSEDPRRLALYLRRAPQLAKRGYRVVPL